MNLSYEGDRPLGIYLVLDGSFKTIKLPDDGRELMTGLFKVDDYLGITALLLDETLDETAEALEDSSICMLPKESLISLLNQYPDIAQQFIAILSNNVREKEGQLLELAYHSVRRRLVKVLIRLAKKTLDNQFKINREELASMAGVATGTVSRTLTHFKDDGLIDKKNNVIQILNMERLIKMKNQ